jgi:hypothetical protein
MSSSSEPAETVNGQGKSWLNRSQSKLQKPSQRLHDNRPRTACTPVAITLASCSSAEVAGQSEGRQVSTGGRPDGPHAAQLMLKSEQTLPRAGGVIDETGRTKFKLFTWLFVKWAREAPSPRCLARRDPPIDERSQAAEYQTTQPVKTDGARRRMVRGAETCRHLGRARIRVEGTFLCWLRHSRPSHLVATGRVSLVSLEWEERM